MTSVTASNTLGRVVWNIETSPSRMPALQGAGWDAGDRLEEPGAGDVVHRRGAGRVAEAGCSHARRMTGLGGRTGTFTGAATAPRPYGIRSGSRCGRAAWR